MPSRRSHEKSHHGCVTCKRRRVKCDETRPTCANCLRRGTECTYLSGYVTTTPDSSHAGSVSTPENVPNKYLGQVLNSRTSQVRKIVNLGEKVHTPGARAIFLFGPLAAPTVTLGLFPEFLCLKKSSSGSILFGFSRVNAKWKMYDLMLMNNWTASTWETLTDQKDLFKELWQKLAVTEACSQPFLMHGILALSALHLASKSLDRPEKSRDHRAAALRHHDQAIALFRPSLSKITAQNCHTIFGFAALLVILSIALPGFPLEENTKSPMEELLMIITLLKGVQGVLTSGLEWIKDGIFGGILEGGLMSCHGEIPTDCRAALSRLKAHNSSLSTNETDVAETYSVTLDRLELSMSRLYARPLDRPCVLGWLVIVPDRFDALLRDGQPMAQVILAHFAVILLTYDFWWSGNWGESLIREISQRLPEEWKPMVRWPLEQLSTMSAQSLYAWLEATASEKLPLEENGAIKEGHGSFCLS